jgi:hypothetical protein
MRNLLIGLTVGLAAFGLAAWVYGGAAPVAAEKPAKSEKAEKAGGKKGLAKDKLPNDPADPPERYVAALPPRDASAPADSAAAVPVPATPPNVVLVLGCTVRKDQISVYGGFPGTTPFLQALADEGTVFDDLIAAAPWTRAASTAVLTGSHPVTVGMVDPGSGRDQRRLPDPVATLAEHMKERGYFTLGATANPNLSTDFGFHQGFEVYQPGLKEGWGHQSGVELVDALLAALKQDRATGDARPVYLRVMLIDAHSPRSAVGDKLDPYREPDVPERVAQYRYHLHQLDGALAHLAEGPGGAGPHRGEHRVRVRRRPRRGHELPPPPRLLARPVPHDLHQPGPVDPARRGRRPRPPRARARQPRSTWSRPCSA